MTDVDPEASYTIGEAARLVGVSWHGVWEAIRDGRLVATGPTGRRRVVGTDLLIWRARRPLPTGRTDAGRVGVPTTVDPAAVYTVTGAATAKPATYETVKRAVESGRLAAAWTPAGWRLLIAETDLVGWWPATRAASGPRSCAERRLAQVVPRLADDQVAALVVLAERLAGVEDEAETLSQR